MPEEAPTQVPTRAPEREADPERERRADPSKLCPAQKVTITRTTAPYLP